MSRDRSDIRADLEEVFRSDYPRVVAIAARVLGSRDQAEDVAQEVFLSFGRSTVPAARGGRLADRRRDPHRPQPAPLRPPSQRPRGGRRTTARPSSPTSPTS